MTLSLIVVFVTAFIIEKKKPLPKKFPAITLYLPLILIAIVVKNNFHNGYMSGMLLVVSNAITTATTILVIFSVLLNILFIIWLLLLQRRLNKVESESEKIISEKQFDY